MGNYPFTGGGGGGGSGTVTSVSAADTSIVIGGSPTVTPTVATGTLDVIATQHPPAANWSNNSNKITSLANGSGAQDAAAFGQIFPISGGTLTGALAPAVSALSQVAGSVAVNAALGNVFTLSLTASGWTIANPSNPVNGQQIQFRFAQDGTGGRTVLWGGAYTFGSTGGVTNAAPTLTVTASKTDILSFEYVASLDGGSSAWVFLGATFPQGY